jgi:type I restriction enzyme, S subunit
MSLEIEYSTIGDFGEVVMGMSPKGDTYNEEEEGLPLLNGPTEFGSSHPIPSLFTTDSKRESNIGDLIFCVRGSTTGRMNWANQIYSLGRGVCAIRGKTDNDTKYIKYVLDVKLNSLLKFAGGGTFPNLKKDDIKDFKIPILKEKDKLVSIISAYDDLIENNLKRIKLLEQAAQNIYKEWFVNLRFPGHENTPINEETGLPKGWKVVLAKEYFDFKRGIEVGSKNYVSEKSENTIPFLRVGSLGSRDKDVFTDISLVKDRILNFEDVCVSMDGSIGLVGYGLIGAYSTGLRKIVAKSNKYSTGFIYVLLKSEEIQDTIRAYAKGSTILHASSSIEHLKFNDANEEISNQFNKIIRPIYSKLLNLNKQNKKLKEARDILLPRLMNRTIEV